MVVSRSSRVASRRSISASFAWSSSIIAKDISLEAMSAVEWVVGRVFGTCVCLAL